MRGDFPVVNVIRYRWEALITTYFSLSEFIDLKLRFGEKFSSGAKNPKQT